MRWEDELGNNNPPTFRANANLPDSICFAALRLRARLAQTGNPTHVPRRISEGTPIPILLVEQGCSTRTQTHIWVQITKLVQPQF